MKAAPNIKNEVRYFVRNLKSTWKLENSEENSNLRHQELELSGLGNTINISAYLSPLQCQICKILFSSKSHKERHVKSIHSKVKDHVCNVCNKGFSRKDSLKLHLQIHSDGRNFKCLFCKKILKSKSSVKYHAQLCPTESREIHKCKHCGKKFRSLHGFRKHMKKHAEDLYKCSVCGMGFDCKSYLRFHVQMVHPEENSD